MTRLGNIIFGGAVFVAVIIFMGAFAWLRSPGGMGEGLLWAFHGAAVIAGGFLARFVTTGQFRA